jgi:hypothetical protein
LSLSGLSAPEQTGYIINETDFYDGIQDVSSALPRSRLISDLFDKVMGSPSRLIHLGSPAASGKTSALQLFEQYAGARGLTCIYVSMLWGGDDVRSTLLLKTGINADRWELEADVNGRCVCDDPTKIFVIMLDDAQSRYSDERLWASLKKANRNLPGNIKFIIAATYSLATADSPVDFRTLPKLVLADFRLNQQEVDEYIRMSSDTMKAEKAGGLLVHPVIRNMVSVNCCGHIGALSISMREIVKHFRGNRNVTVEEMVSFYLSGAMFSLFRRCYNSKTNSVSEEMQECLVRCLTVGPHSVPGGADNPEYRQLVRCGVLEETEHHNVTKFTSPAAASYINDLIFPRRAKMSVANIKLLGVFGLMKAVVGHMSGTTLRQSVVDAPTDMPCEVTFQHLMMAALEAKTPPDCFICPELSKFFPPTLSQEMEGKEAASLLEVKGRCEYYLNGGLRWAIEALINGNDVGEHLSRLEGGGKYVGLNYSDYLVVDFRVNANGEPTNVQRHQRRMSVFFKRGDFRYCNVLCGLEQPAERIVLAH